MRLLKASQHFRHSGSQDFLERRHLIQQLLLLDHKFASYEIKKLLNGMLECDWNRREILLTLEMHCIRFESERFQEFLDDLLQHQDLNGWKILMLLRQSHSVVLRVIRQQIVTATPFQPQMIQYLSLNLKHLKIEWIPILVPLMTLPQEKLLSLLCDLLIQFPDGKQYLNNIYPRHIDTLFTSFSKAWCDLIMIFCRDPRTSQVNSTKLFLWLRQINHTTRPSHLISLCGALALLCSQNDVHCVPSVLQVYQILTNYDHPQERLNLVVYKLSRLLRRLITFPGGLDALELCPIADFQQMIQTIVSQLSNKHVFYLGLLSDIMTHEICRARCVDLGIMEPIISIDLEDPEVIQAFLQVLERAMQDSGIRFKLKIGYYGVFDESAFSLASQDIQLERGIIQKLVKLMIDLKPEKNQQLFKTMADILNLNFGRDPLFSHYLGNLNPPFYKRLIQILPKYWKLSLDFDTIEQETIVSLLHLIDALFRNERHQQLFDRQDADLMAQAILDWNHQTITELILRIMTRILKNTHLTQQLTSGCVFSHVFEPFLLLVKSHPQLDQTIKQLSKSMVPMQQEMSRILLQLINFTCFSIEACIAIGYCLGPFLVYKLFGGYIDTSNFKDGYPSLEQTENIWHVLYLNALDRNHSHSKLCLEYLERFVPLARDRFLLKHSSIINGGRLQFILDNQSLLKTENDITVILTMEEASIQVSHTLFEHSSVFRAMISDAFSENQTKIVRLDNVSIKTWSVFQQFYETSETKELISTLTNVSNICDTLEFADRYLVQDLADACLEYLQQSMLSAAIMRQKDLCEILYLKLEHFKHELMATNICLLEQHLLRSLLLSSC
ncbi:hypothetical protein EDD86DRAFT_271341 [Gorgonomyces haynaldii]|nr:hypothetical protein EDD86DRAFT_271341 [Gorgonomyces haynaldii]